MELVEETAAVLAGKLGVAASMAYFPERRLSFDFSVPVSRAAYAIWVPRASAIASMADLADRRVVLQQGGAMADTKELKNSSAKLSFVPNDEDALVLFDSRRFDAAIMPLAQGLYYVRTMRLSDIRPLPGAILSVDQCFAVRKGNERLARELDAALALVAFLLAVALAFVVALRRTVRRRTEELAANERKYRTLAESLPQMIFVKDKDSTYVSCNRLYAEFMGIDPDSVAGKTERMRLEEETRRSLREKEILLQEINHRVKNNLQLINAILRLELDESPGPALEGFVKDTTARISAI